MLMQFKKSKQTEADLLTNSVYAAMETGNPARAREVLAAAPESLDGRIATLRIEVMQKYGVRL